MVYVLNNPPGTEPDVYITVGAQFIASNNSESETVFALYIDIEGNNESIEKT